MADSNVTRASRRRVEILLTSEEYQELAALAGQADESVQAIGRRAIKREIKRLGAELERAK